MIAPPIILNNITNAFVDIIKFLRNITSYRNPLAYLSIAGISYTRSFTTGKAVTCF